MNVEATLKTLRGVIARNHGIQGPALELLVRAMAHDGAQREDPIRAVFTRLGQKWNVLLLLLLRTGTYRLSVLKQLVSVVGADGRISQRMLNISLRSLERDGFVMRTTYSTRAPRVDYSLTALGTGLVELIEAQMRWIREHQQSIHQARRRFADAHAKQRSDN